MPAIDMTKIYKEYRGLWVALTDEHKVVASGEDGRQVYEDARKKGEESPILYHVPARGEFFIGKIV